MSTLRLRSSEVQNVLTTRETALGVGEFIPPILLTVRQAAELLSVSRSTAYRLIRDGQLEVVRIGRSARVPHSAVIDLVQRLRDDFS